jgi:hypothetical protein
LRFDFAPLATSLANDRRKSECPFRHISTKN